MEGEWRRKTVNQSLNSLKLLNIAAYLVLIGKGSSTSVWEVSWHGHVQVDLD